MSDPGASAGGLRSRWEDPGAIWRDLRNLLFGIGLMVALDLTASAILSVALPESFFLKLYLDDSYDDVIHDFRVGAAMVVPDEASGWRMRPDTVAGNLATDPTGARIHPMVDHPAAPIDVLLLGSSVMNGGLRAAPGETLGSYLEDDRIHAVNHGTMLHSLDQSLMAYRSRLQALDADVVVVGIHADYESASNLFVPLRSRDELFMPFIKPGFRNRDGRLEFIPLPPVDQADHAKWATLLEYLRENDSSYEVFESYRRWGVMPISSFLRDCYLRIRHRSTTDPTVLTGVELQRLLLDELAREVEQNGARFIVVKFADLPDYRRTWESFVFGDFNDLHDEMLRDSGHEVVFLQDLLEASGRPLESLYRTDGVHLTPVAYQLLAEALRSRIMLGSADESAALPDSTTPPS